MNYFTILSEIAEHNKYYTWYLGICQLAKVRNLVKGNGKVLEKHHIIPRSFGLRGEKDLDNLVMLTPREHYIVHLVLARMFNKNSIYKKKMIYAIWRLSNRGVSYIPNSRKYEFAKVEMIKLIKLRIDSGETRLKKSRPGKLNGMYGKTHTKEVKQKLADLRKKELSGKTYEDRHGKDKAEELKKDRSNKLKTYLSNNPGSREGKNNPRALRYKIISPTGIEFDVHGTLKRFCKEQGLSFDGLYKTLKTGKLTNGKNSGWQISYVHFSKNH